jgi:hypothetical protein
MISKLYLVDNYLDERKKNKTTDLITMMLISAREFYPILADRINHFNINNFNIRMGNQAGYNTNGLNNHEYGYYYITRCSSEKIFNQKVFTENIVKILSFSGKNPAPTNRNHRHSIASVTNNLKRIYTDFMSQDNKHYYYDISFNDHTFLIAKYNNNFRIIQSWMLKYQLENIKFDNDIHNCFPKFITLLFIYQYYSCMSHTVNIIQIIKNVFECNNLQAKQYLDEFKNLYILIFSKELHIDGNSFKLHLEYGSERYLCPKHNVIININKHEFNPDLIMQNYLFLVNDVNVNDIINFDYLKTYYDAKMNAGYPFIDSTTRVIIDNSIREIINYQVYWYLSKDNHYDAQLLNYILKNYNIRLDLDLYLDKLIKFAEKKYLRNTELIKMRNTRRINKSQAILDIYKNTQMEQFAGNNKISPTSLSLNHSQNIYLNQLSKSIVYPNEKNKKNENLNIYTNQLNLMSFVTTLLDNTKIYQPFNSLNMNNIFEPEEIEIITNLYESVKSNVIDKINSYVSVTLNSILKKLDVPEQIVLIIILFLTKPNIEPVLIDIIIKSKRHIFDFMSEIIEDEIIPGFYNQSYETQKNILSNFNIIDKIIQHKDTILKIIDSFVFDIPSEIKLINQYQNEIINVRENNFSDKIISNYVLPILSSKNNEEKMKTLFGFKTNITDESGIRYINTLLDTEIIYFCPNNII